VSDSSTSESLYKCLKIQIKQTYLLIQYGFFYLQGRFSIAAKHHISVAEVYETELVDIDKVII